MDLIETFVTASTVERLKMIKDSGQALALKDYFGEAVFDEYARLAERLDLHHLSVSHQTNLLFVPGIMGSLLLSRTKGGIWWIDLRNLQHIDDLRLAADGARDADPNNQVAPCSIDQSYEPFLTAVLERDDFGHEVFPYDWRKPLSASAASLRDLIIRTFETNGNERIHLVGHSMGGLMIRTTIMLYGDELWPKLGRIVFIGTPHYGSPAIAGYLKNHLWGFEMMALLGIYLSRETYRSLWGVLSLLPAPRGVYPGTRKDQTPVWNTNDEDDEFVHPCFNFDIYRAEDWKLGLTEEQYAHLQGVLDGAADAHRKLLAWHQSLDQELKDRMLMIAGVGYKTLFRLAYQRRFWGLWEQSRKETARLPGDPHREGDGRVPLASALIEDVETRYVKGVHGGLQNISEVYDDVFRWLKEQSTQLPESVAEALSQHLSASAGESEAPHLDGTASAKPFTDDPGLWDMTAISAERLAELRNRAEEGQIPEFFRTRLL